MTESNKKKEHTNNSEVIRSTNLERFKYTVFALSFYTYFSGALYFYGMMSSFGFKGASLDSIFSPLVYSQYFATNILSKAFFLGGFKALLFPLKTTLIITLIVFVSALVTRFKFWKHFSEKISKKTKKNTFNTKNLPLISLLTFPIIYLSQLLTAAALVALISIMSLPLFAPYLMGEAAGKKIIESNNGEVCQSFDWNSKDYKNRNIVLSCEKVRVTKSGKVVSGKVIHTDNKFVYAITNDLLIRIKNHQVVSCRKKQYKQDRSSPTEREDKIITCEDLYQYNYK